MALHLILYSQFKNKSYVYDFEADRVDDISEMRKNIYIKAKNLQMTSSFSIHSLSTSSYGFASVRELDSYFEKSIQFFDLDDFFNLLKEKNILDAIDVASYLVRRRALKPFSLQKTLYYLYADWLTKYKKPLFTANFVALDYGPVEKSVYREYNTHTNSLIKNIEFESKLLFLNDLKFEVLDKIDELSNLSDYYNSIWENGEQNNPAKNFTHKSNSPWSIAKTSCYPNPPVTDELILNYHHNEAF